MTNYYKPTFEERKFIAELFKRWRETFDVGAEVFKLDTPAIGTKEDYLISLAVEFVGHLVGRELANSTRGAEKVPGLFAANVSQAVETSILSNYNLTIGLNLRDRAKSDLMFADLLEMLRGLGMPNPHETAAKYGINPDTLKQVVEDVKKPYVKGDRKAFDPIGHTVTIFPSGENSTCDCEVCKVANGLMTASEYKSHLSISDDFTILVACPTCDEAGCNDCEGKGSTSLAEYHTRRKIKTAHPH